MKAVNALATFLKKNDPNPPKLPEISEFIKACSPAEKFVFAAQACKLLGVELDSE